MASSYAETAALTSTRLPLPATVFLTSLGWMAVAWQSGRLVGTTFGHASASAAWRQLHVPSEPVDPDAFAADVIARLQIFAEGDCDDDFLDVPLATDEMTAFRQRVTAGCRQIPVGQTCTYGELAARAGRPGAARAVGRVMSSNPFPLIVPCHRVVGAGGGLGGYSAPQGLTMKRRLLQMEQAAAGS